MSKFFLLIFISIALFSCQEDRPNPIPTGNVKTTSINPIIDGLNKKIEADPTNLDLYYHKAGVLYEHKKYLDAELVLEKAIRMDSMEPKLYHLYSDVLLDDKKSLKSLRTMQKVKQLFPKRIATLLKLASLYFLLEQDKKAFSILNEVFTIDPQNAEGFFLTSQLYQDKKEWEKAFVAMKKAVNLENKIQDGWLELGLLAAKLNEPLAVNYFDNAIRLDSLNPSAYLAKGNFFANSGNFLKAIEVFRNMSIRLPQNADGLYNAGLAYLQIDSIQQANIHFNLATKMNPSMSIAYYYRGETNKAMGNMEQAKKDYQYVLELDPKFERAKDALKNMEN